MNAELSMRNVRRLLERNRLAYTIEGNSLLFNRQFNQRTGEKSYYEIYFMDGPTKVGRQRLVFGSTDYNVYDEDGFATTVCLRKTDCTDMAFFAFHFHDLFPSFYPIDEYNDWSE